MHSGRSLPVPSLQLPCSCHSCEETCSGMVVTSRPALQVRRSLKSRRKSARVSRRMSHPTTPTTHRSPLTRRRRRQRLLRARQPPAAAMPTPQTTTVRRLCAQNLVSLPVAAWTAALPPCTLATCSASACTHQHPPGVWSTGDLLPHLQCPAHPPPARRPAPAGSDLDDDAMMRMDAKIGAYLRSLQVRAAPGCLSLLAAPGCLLPLGCRRPPVVSSACPCLPARRARGAAARRSAQRRCRRCRCGRQRCWRTG